MLILTAESHHKGKLKAFHSVEVKDIKFSMRGEVSYEANYEDFAQSIENMLEKGDIDKEVYDHLKNDLQQCEIIVTYSFDQDGKTKYDRRCVGKETYVTLFSQAGNVLFTNVAQD